MVYKPTESLDVTWYARNESWRRIKRRDHVTDLPERMRGLSIRDLPDDAAGRWVAKWCERWEAFPNPGIPTQGLDGDNRGIGLWIRGRAGIGKTTLAAIAAQYVSDLGWSTKFIRVPDLIGQTIRVSKMRDPDEQERYQSGLDCYEAAWDGWRLAVLDDLGHEHAPIADGFSQKLVHNLIRSRFSGAAPTIVTTNLTMAEVRKRYGAAMADYIREAFWTVTVAGVSRRGS